MAVYISLLRGINVGGHKKIPMKDLKALYESAGFTDFKTYIQSGNVVFNSTRKDIQRINTDIEKAITDSFGFPVTVITREAGDLGKIIKQNPFAGRDGIDEKHLFVVFLGAKPSATAVKDLSIPPVKTRDELKVSALEVFVHCPDGYGQTPYTNLFFEKKLKVAATARNWRTTTTLYAMATGENQE
ncbi:MAG: DUF1697 domain-containing protein [Bacteroidetes bacterium]|nr:DUF1697 domain-containing protein [Bacteroidota bacterium]